MIDHEDVVAAQSRIAETVRWTPLDYSNTYSARTGTAVYLKYEMFQRTGSFKIRGATNRILTLDEPARDAGVVTASAGNHAQGVALAATRNGVDATVVMPEHAPISKVRATRDYGAMVELHGEDYNDAAARAHEIERQEHRTYVHAFDDDMVMAGQGTIGLEIIEDCPSVDTIVVPIGGGGLISGIATAVAGRDDDVRVIGVQAEGASSAAKSLEKGELHELDAVETIADGMATRRIGESTFEVIRNRVDEVVTVSDADIVEALIYLLERSKCLVEGAGAASLAALLTGQFDFEDDEVIVPILSGGNIDLNMLTTVIMRGLVELGRYLKIRTTLKDRPGALHELLGIIADQQANIYAVRHDRTSRDIAMDATDIELDLEMRGPEHVEGLLAALERRGYDVEVVL